MTDELTAAINKLILITKVNGSLLKNANNDKQIGTIIPYTFTNPATPFTVFKRSSVAGPYGARLASVSMAVNAFFQTDYYWRCVIDGISPPGGSSGSTSGFQPWDPTVNTFEEVPTGNPFLLRPGAGVAIFAYNAVSTNTNNGIMSISVVAADLTEEEWNAVK